MSHIIQDENIDIMDSRSNNDNVINKFDEESILNSADETNDVLVVEEKEKTDQSDNTDVDTSSQIPKRKSTSRYDEKIMETVRDVKKLGFLGSSARANGLSYDNDNLVLPPSSFSRNKKLGTFNICTVYPSLFCCNSYCFVFSRLFC